MKKEYIVKLGIPKARLDEDPKVLGTIEEKIGLEAIKEKHMYAFARCGEMVTDALLLSPMVESFGPGIDIAFYSFRVTDMIEQRREDLEGVMRIFERALGDLVDYDKDISKGLVKGMHPYEISGTDVPVSESLIRQDEKQTKILLEQGFFAAMPHVDYSISYLIDKDG